jgi:hypothetical protein
MIYAVLLKREKLKTGAIMFENTLQYKEDAEQLEEEWNHWRSTDAEVNDYVDQFAKLCKKHDKLAEKIARAYYLDTNEYNSWKTIQECFLSQGNAGTVKMNPINLINQCIRWSKES